MEKQLSDWSEVELKAIKSDCYEAIQVNQQNLTIINQELAKRNKPEQVEVERGEETKE